MEKTTNDRDLNSGEEVSVSIHD